jgi:hypothetical protein
MVTDLIPLHALGNQAMYSFAHVVNYYIILIKGIDEKNQTLGVIHQQMLCFA